MLEHKHIVIRATVGRPPNPSETDYMVRWFHDLIKALGMTTLMGPYVYYLDKPDNRGFTGIAAIETSHIALHVWDETSPALFQLDVYTCSQLDTEVVFRFLSVFDPIDVEYILLDRKQSLKVIG